MTQFTSSGPAGGYADGPLPTPMSSQPIPSMRVVLTHGHQLLREVRLEKPLVIAGRDPGCDIVIDDITVSKQHLKLEYRDGVLYVEDLGSTNGLKVNGHLAKRQALQHLDVVQVGSHRMHVFDDALLPATQLNAESTVQTAVQRREAERSAPFLAVPVADDGARTGGPLPLADTQPTAAARGIAPLLGLKRVGTESPLLLLDQPNTMIGDAGQSAVLAWRRDSLYLTRLSRDMPRINGRDLGAGSAPIRAGDVIEVGSAKYLVVTVDR